ncbi:MAG: flagellar biosynthesis protein FliQ [Armatimonadetes bacterium]|nr:flagellar biosynthesis protein FliQ [Armatimonadota bacterium]
MSHGEVLEISRQAVQVAIMVSMPILAVSLFLGLLVSVFQAMTQIQEATLTFLPKMIGASIILAVMGSWMLTTLVAFTQSCFGRIATIGVGG